MGRETRRRIIDEATLLFGQLGFRSASLREIASRCGTSHAALLYHFPTKEHLLKAVLEHRDELDTAFFPDSDDSPDETLSALIRVTRHNAETPGLVELFTILATAATHADHPARAYFFERYAELRTGLTSAFAQLSAEGWTLPEATPRQLANATIALMDGLQIQWLQDRRSVDMAEELSAFLHTVVPGWKDPTQNPSATRTLTP